MGYEETYHKIKEEAEDLFILLSALSMKIREESNITRASVLKELDMPITKAKGIQILLHELRNDLDSDSSFDDMIASELRSLCENLREQNETDQALIHHLQKENYFLQAENGRLLERYEKSVHDQSTTDTELNAPTFYDALGILMYKVWKRGQELSDDE